MSATRIVETLASHVVYVACEHAVKVIGVYLKNSREGEEIYRLLSEGTGPTRCDECVSALTRFVLAPSSEADDLGDQVWTFSAYWFSRMASAPDGSCDMPRLFDCTFAILLRYCLLTQVDPHPLIEVYESRLNLNLDKKTGSALTRWLIRILRAFSPRKRNRGLPFDTRARHAGSKALALDSSTLRYIDQALHIT